MDLYQNHVRQVIQSSLEKAPEDMLEDCLNILIEISGASGGSILGEEGPHLQFLFSDVKSLIGVKVPWDSLAGASAQSGAIIYTYAPTDKRHFGAIDEQISRRTEYLLSIPVPSVHRSAGGEEAALSAGALQLLFDHDIFPEFDVSAEAKEFKFEALREHESYNSSLQEVFWILPNISFGLEVMKLRKTSHQAIHELKNKLISAQSWLNCLKEDIEALAEGVFEDEEVGEDFTLASNSITEGANLAKSYLQFTKLYTPHFEETDLNTVLKDTGASIGAFVEDNAPEAFKVVMDLAPDLPHKMLDASQLKMAFFNLGKNAAEALIEFKTPSPQITITSHSDGDKCFVRVADNGPGMPEEIAENLFVAFKTKKEGGTGLGLTITKKIIEIHGGIIQCETGSDGTAFKIEI